MSHTISLSHLKLNESEHPPYRIESIELPTLEGVDEHWKGLSSSRQSMDETIITIPTLTYNDVWRK